MSTVLDERRSPDRAKRTRTDRLPGPVWMLLARLRWSIRAYAVVDGLSVAAIWILSTFWLGWLVDWWWEPSWRVRVAGLAVVGVVALALVVRLIVRRVFRRLPNASMALLVERRFAGYGDGLLTAVELCERSTAKGDATLGYDDGSDEARAMLDHTIAGAQTLARQTSLRAVFNLRPLVVKAALAGVLLLSVATAAIFERDALAFYLERLRGSEEPWPRKTLLVVEGFWAEFAVVANADDDSDELHVYAGGVKLGGNGTPSGSSSEIGANSAVVDAPNAIRVCDDSVVAKAPMKLLPASEVIPPLDSNMRMAAPVAGPGVAVLRRTADCLWRGDARGFTPGARLSMDEYELITGRCELLFNGGTLVTVQGPARFELASSSRFVLAAGRVVVRTPLRPNRFTLATPRREYVAAPIDTIKVVRGGDVTITALADSLRTLPEYVEVVYRGEGGASGREILRQEAAAIPGRDEFQRYTVTLKNVLGSLDLELVGGDDRTSDIRIDAVDSPRLVETRVACLFPKYLVDARSGRFTPREIKVDGPLELPAGTEIMLKARASKPLVRVDIASADGAKNATIDVAEKQRRGRPSLSDVDTFEFNLGKLDRTTTLLVTLHDADGVTNRDPIPVQFTAIADEPPRVAMRLFGVGSTITPEARLRPVGEIADDHAIDRIWFSVTADSKGMSLGTVERPFAQAERAFDQARWTARAWRTGKAILSGANKTDERETPTAASAAAEARRSETFDLREFKLPTGRGVAPGDQLLVSVKAADRCDLRPATANGEGDRVALEVVSPEDLLGRLEAQEVLLRERLLTIIDELEQTRDALGELKEESPSATGVATGTTPEAAAATRRSLATQVERAAQNSERSNYEVTALAGALDDIGEELVTNRLDVPARRDRLARQLIEPLRSTATDRYPKFDARLTALRGRAILADQLMQDRQQLAALTDANSAVAKSLAAKIAQSEKRQAGEAQLTDLVAAARREADAIIVDLRAVLASMTDAGDFNQLVEELRELNKRQEELRKRTREQQKRSLLE